MARDFQFEELSRDEKKILLSAFNYGVDEDGHIVDLVLAEKVRSNVTRKPLLLNAAALLPGSLKVVDSDPVTLSQYLREEVEANGSNNSSSKS